MAETASPTPERLEGTDPLGPSGSEQRYNPGHMSFLRHFDELYYPHLGNRRDSFRQVFQMLEQSQRPFYSIIETGTTYLHSIANGAPEIFPHGHSTVLFDRFVSYYDGSVQSIDVSARHCSVARSLVSPRTTLIAGDSIAVLRALEPPRPIDCLYLDSVDIDWDAPHPGALHSLRELCAALPHLAADAIVLVDDHDHDRGRGRYVRDRLDRLGARLLFDGYQAAWSVPRRREWTCPASRYGKAARTVAAGIEANLRYRCRRSGSGETLIELLPGGRIRHGTESLEELWHLDERPGGDVRLTFEGGGETTAQLILQPDGRWHGRNRERPQETLDLMPVGEPTTRESAVAERLASHRSYRYVRAGHDDRALDLLTHGRIGRGRRAGEQVWFVKERADQTIALILAGNGQLTCRMMRDEATGVWRGRLLSHEELPVELHELRASASA